MFFWETISEQKLWHPIGDLNAPNNPVNNLKSTGETTFYYPPAHSNIIVQMKTGVLYSTHIPAVVYEDGSREEWWCEGELHRNGGELGITTIRPSGLTVHEWWERGKRHRSGNLPAVSCDNLNLPWDVQQKPNKDRKRKPLTKTEPVNYEEFWVDGLRHNPTGAAFKLGNFQQSHWHNGTLIKTNQQLHAAKNSTNQEVLSQLTNVEDS